MPAVAALPMAKKLRLEGLIATFVVPAPRGCNLNCSFCIVRARREAPAGASSLQVEDYVRFFEALCEREPTGLMSLQGYEPLLPESWSYSEALLARSAELGVPSALVTNGTHLAEHVDDLVRLGVAGVTISLDSADPVLHDLSRGTPGAFEQTLNGLRAVAASELRDRTLVASVLQSRRAHYLDGIPALLASLGIQEWIVTPMLRIGRESAGSTVQGYAEIIRELIRLNRLAKSHGIDMLVDDEFEKLVAEESKVVPIESPQFRRLPRLSRVVRLSPDGSCSVGEEILRRVDDAVPHWNPHESAGRFVTRRLPPAIGRTAPPPGAHV
jgi:MoaA/NifB/PqqE/SkfB family radical SAM enzyme